jgi:hypothetical protein
MMLVACHCSWGIPGVEWLPAHHHPWSPNEGEHREVRERHDGGGAYVVFVRDLDPDEEPRFWVDWKAVSRSDVFGSVRSAPSAHLGPETTVAIP